MAKKTAKANEFVKMLQKSVNTDIQAVKAGALDEELLRSRITDDPDPSSPTTRLVLWLCALCTGIIDDLSIVVLDNGGKPEFVFAPEIHSRNAVNAPVLELHVPGPRRVEQHEPPALAPNERTQTEVVAEQP